MMKVDLSEKLDTGINVTLADRQGNAYIVAKSSEIAYFKKDGTTSLVTLKDGAILNSVQTYEDLRKLLSASSFTTIQRGISANIKLVRSIKPVSRGNYLLSFDGNQNIILNSAYSSEFKDYFNLESLDHITPFDRPSYWLMEEDIHLYDKAIHLMTREELISNFSDQTGNPVISLLIANFLYQYAIRIRSGEYEPLEGGNVRSMWYIIKPAISKLGALDGYDHYKSLSEVLARLVTHKIVTYKEYGLSEEENWVLGKTNPHVIVLAEKRAHFKFVKGLNQQYGVTVISTGGIPAMITMEALSEALTKTIPQVYKATIPIITLTDYDPSGDLIVSTFIDDLKTYNIRKTVFIRMVHPENFTSEEVETYKYSLVGDNEATPTMVKKWIKKTGGINGQPYGLETDALMISPSKVRELFLKKVRPYLNNLVK